MSSSSCGDSALEFGLGTYYELPPNKKFLVFPSWKQRKPNINRFAKVPIYSIAMKTKIDEYEGFYGCGFCYKDVQDV